MAFPKSYTPRWIVFLIDLFIAAVSISLAFLLRFNFEIPEQYLGSISFIIPLALFVKALNFIIFRSYAGIIRYSSIRDTERILMVSLSASIVFGLINLVSFYWLNYQFIMPFSVIIIDFFTSVFFLISFRLLVKLLFIEIINPNKISNDIVIYGAGQLGITAKRTLDKEAGSKSKVVAILDNNPSHYGKILDGITIQPLANLDKIYEKNKLDKLIIAKQGISPEEKQQVVEACLDKDIKVLTVPDIETWINGELSYNQIKEIKIEDLLERPPIVLDEKGIKKSLLNKTVLVTGAAGSIGSEIVRQLIRFNPKKIILFDQAESPLYDMELELLENYSYSSYEIVIGNIADNYRIQKIFDTFNPTIVYHAAAYKHVPMMESNPSEALRTNILGTKIIADISNKENVEKFVMVSTDKAVNPTNVMGASKRIAEIYIQSLNQVSSTNFVTTRFGNVLGSNGSVILRFKKQIDSGGPVTVTHPEITRFFMTIPEACQLVLEASAMSEGGEIYIFDMGKSVKILDLAKKMIKLSGLQIGRDIQIKYTGLRPGEKLYEELLNDKENTIPTYHSKIMIAKVPQYDFENVQLNITRLLEIRKKHNNTEIVRLMKSIVPEFKSKNSVFEELDIELEKSNER